MRARKFLGRIKGCAGQNGRRKTIASVASVLLVGSVVTTITVQRQTEKTSRAKPPAMLNSAKPNRPVPVVPAAKYDKLPGATPLPAKELVERRTARSSTWLEADGSLGVRQYASQHFFQTPGSAKWTEINSKLAPVKGKQGWVESGANNWSVSFGPGGLPGGGGEQIKVGAHTFSIVPQNVTNGANPPVVSGSTATYKSIWPATDMKEEVTSGSVKEDLILSNASAPSRFAFTVSGATPKLNAQHGVDLAAGADKLGSFPAPTVSTKKYKIPTHGPTSGKPALGYVTGGGDVTSVSGAHFEVNNKSVSVVLSAGWLASLPVEAFPVVVDPVYDVPSQYPSQLVGLADSGASVGGQMRVGYDTSTGASWEGLAYIDAPALPAPAPGNGPWQLASAHFQASCTSCGIYSGVVWGVDGSAAAVPNYYSVYGGTALYAQEQYSSAANFDVDVLSWFQGKAGAWVGVTGVNRGFGHPDTYLPPAVFASNQVSVTFEYINTLPPTQLINPVDKGVVATTAPTLTAKVTALPNDPYPADYLFKVSTGPHGTGPIVDSGWVSGPTWTVPVGSLVDGATYYVRVFNESGAGTIPGYPNYVSPRVGPETTFRVKQRLGDGGPSPTDTIGAAPGSTSTPSQGAPSPGTSPSSETVDMVTGNLALAVGTHSVAAVGGAAGITLTYNSAESSISSGKNFGLLGQYYLDDGTHNYPSSMIGQRVDGTVNLDSAGFMPAPDTQRLTTYLVRWSGYLTLPAGNWAVGGLIAGGMRIYVNNSPSAAFDVWQGNWNPDSPQYGQSTIQGGVRVPIKVEAWSSGGRFPGVPAVQLWAKNVNITDPNTPNEFMAQSNWMTPTLGSLPVGWFMSSTAAAWSSVYDYGTQVTLRAPTGSTAMFTRLPDGTYQAPPGNNDYLSRNGAGRLQLATSDNFLYTFNPDGALASMTSVVDDRHPAALQYTYSGNPAVMRVITDQVSSRVVNLYYGGDSACPTGNNAPIGMLCSITYWDGTTSSFRYNSNGQLAGVASPGAVNSLFAYDADGHVNVIRDALANDALAAGQITPGANCSGVGLSTSCPTDTRISYDTAGRVATVTQPAPDGGTALRPQRTYTYGTGTTSVTIAGFSPASGAASSVTYDVQSRITSKTDSVGHTTKNVWDNVDAPIVGVDPNGLQISTVYDAMGQPIDTYGPAPVACFTASSWPAGVGAAPSPVVGYLPVANPPGTAGCSVPSVPHTHTDYDQGITGLAESFWSNGQFAGPVATHATGVGGNYPGCSTVMWQDTQHAYLPIASGLCGSWAAGSPPVPGDAAGQWSTRMTGRINWTQPTGDYEFVLQTTAQPFKFYIDGRLLLTNLRYDDPSTPSGVSALGDDQFMFGMTPGSHTIEVDMVGNVSQAKAYAVTYRSVTFNRNSAGFASVGPLTGLSGLDPVYGLKTSTTDANNKTTTMSYTGAGIGAELGLVTSTTDDATGTAPLTTTTAYEPATPSTCDRSVTAPGGTSCGFFRRTSTTLPGGNATTYTYYGGTGAPLAAVCGVSANTPQGGQLRTQSDPAPSTGAPSRQQQFVYDAAGRQVGRRVGQSTTIGSAGWQCTTYDSRGRIATEAWPAFNGAAARKVTYTYNLNGDPLSSAVVDDTTAGQITSRVDLLGRMISYIDAYGKITSVSYDQAGRVANTQGPGGNLTDTYDPNSSQVSTVTDGVTLLATPTYDTTTGRLSSVQYSNNTHAQLTYDQFGRQKSLTFLGSAGGTLTNDFLLLAPSGRLNSENSPTQVNYSYDGLGRVATAADITGYTTYNYTDNPAADGCANPTAGKNTNRTNVTLNPSSGTASTIDYCYDKADRVVAAIKSGTKNTQFTYDDHGNQTNDQGTTMTWDASDRLTSTTSPTGAITTYKYDALDRVIAHTSGGSTTYSAHGGFNDVPVATLNATAQVTQHFVALPGGAQVTVQASGNIWSYPDLHGNFKTVTDNTGAQIGVANSYDPWGKPAVGNQPLPNAAGGVTLGAFGGNGKVTDNGNGLIIMGARAYNPTEGRFLSVDPVQGGCANAYTYAYGDPLGKGDLSGRAACQDSGAQLNCGTEYLVVPYCQVDLSPQKVAALRKNFSLVSLSATAVVALVGVIASVLELSGPLAPVVGSILAVEAIDLYYHLMIAEDHHQGLSIKANMLMTTYLDYTYVNAKPCG